MMLEQICLTLKLYNTKIDINLIVAYKSIIAAKVFLGTINAVKFNFLILSTALS